jgi:uncharacterized delta-60 repeat protein
MLTTFRSKCLFVIAVLIGTIGIVVVYPLGASSTPSTLLNASPRPPVVTLKRLPSLRQAGSPSPSSPADGNLDPAFNPGGAGPNSDVLAVAMQSDGKIVITGFFTSYNGDIAASDYVMRLNADGTRDTTFNAGGAGANATVYAVAVQPDGKILIAGQFTSYNGDATASDYVMRLNADGTRDTTFNAGGSGANDYVWGFALQPDGKILVAGNFFTYNGNPTSGRVMRLNTDGTSDTTFNANGLGANGSVSAVAVQPDGKIVIAGLFTSYNGDAAASDYVMRLNADGTRDTSFNPIGTGADNWVHAVAVQSDGKIVIGGDFASYNGDAAASDHVMRLHSDGTRDTNFNAGGTGADATVNVIAVQPDGKIVIGGSFTGYNGAAGASDYLIRLNTDGKLDTTFNPGGTGANALVYGLAVQPDGRIVVGGQFTAYNGDVTAPAYVIRLLSTPTTVCSGVPAGIISWWPGGGNAQDIVGHFDGTLQNGATFGTGMVGQAFSLDGIDDAIVVNDNAALNPASITVEAWIKPNSVPAGTIADVVTKWGFDATIDSYFLGLFNSGGVVRVLSGIGDGATGDPGITGGTVTLNAWNHIAMTYDAASGLNRLFVNGVFVGQRVRAHGIYPTTSRVFIGNEDSNNHRFFNGLIDEPTIYGRALTDAEILAIYNAGGNGKCGASAKTDTNTSVSLSPDTSVYGQSVTFASAVSSASGSGVPTGTVQFFADAAPLGGPQDVISGVATLTTNVSTVGAHVITATYSGDSLFNGSSSTQANQTVNKANTFTQITSHSPSPTVVGQPYIVGFTVGANAPSAAIPVGTVTVTDGTGQSCTASLTDGLGGCVIASTTVGVKSLSAAYSGGNSFNASVSAAITHPVSVASTSTTISTSPNPSYFGLDVTLLANVTAVAPGGGTPTGIVAFMDGKRALGTASLVAGQASFTASSLTVGTHTIVASYRGDLNYNGSFGGTSHQVLTGTVASGFILPNNGGFVRFSANKAAGKLTGDLTYFRGGTSFFFGTKVTSLVIDGQMARMEGFSDNGQLFVATAYDGGPAPLDNFRLWIEGVEQTAGGAIIGGNVLVQPWGPDTRLKGSVDLHTHPMSNLAFGGKLFHGAPDVGSLMPAVQMPYDLFGCRFDNRAISIAEALSQDGPTHGPPLPFLANCGDFGRYAVILALEALNDAAVPPPAAVGYPTFANWPRWNDITHQKMWVDWIRRAWDGGQRVMVALSHNNRMLAEVVGVAGGGPISGHKNDKDSSDLQIEEIKKLVAAHPDFMAIARSSAELQSVIQSNRLAVVLGVEIDKIGDFSPGVTQQTVEDEITRLYDQGVRYIFPIHLEDNVFGDTAIYQELFDIANFRENGSFWSVGCAPEADEVGFRAPSLTLPAVLNLFIPPGTPNPPKAPDCVTVKPTGPLFLGHVNARSPNGLTSLGEFALKAMMKRGMIIDIDHMSDRAANRALALANFSPGGYPLMSGHTGIRERNSSHLNAENARTKAQLAQVACLGGMFGLGTDGIGAYKWAGAYAEIYEIMRRAFAPGGACPQATPLGVSFVALGTDMNSLVRTPPPTMIDTGGLPPRFTDIYNPSNPINVGLPPLSKSTTGFRTWDYNFDGVAHYGMYVDFLRDVRTWGGTATLTGHQIVDDQVMYAAENFYRMWLKAETQKTQVP